MKSLLNFKTILDLTFKFLLDNHVPNKSFVLVCGICCCFCLFSLFSVLAVNKQSMFADLIVCVFTHIVL